MPQRKSNRLLHFDYSSSGAYFITICVKDKKNLLWTVGARIAHPDEPLPLTDYGNITKESIQNIDKKYPFVHVDKYVIMPNHIHMIIQISKPTENEIQTGPAIRKQGRALRAPTISTVINQMKGFATKQIGFSIWQKSFHDHIIRNEDDYIETWRYIDTNPLKWQEDCFYNGSL